MSETDLELLARYARQHAEDAFAEIVRRHLGLVHSAALRQVRSPQLAEEVAQATFINLARHADRLAPDTILVAWLYQVTRREAIDVIRRETRRQLREQIATEMNAMNATDADWTHIAPLLDDAMHALDETDRAAVLLRYFENKSLREVGATLGTSDDAAQKRVSRAVERLREFFVKHGVTAGAGGLAVVISANAVQAAPVGLAVTISTAAAALAGTTAIATAAATATKAIAMTTLQKTLIAAALVAAVGTGIYEARQASVARDRVNTLQLQQAALTEQIEQMTFERDEAARRLAASSEIPGGSKAELLSLRGEVGRLRAEAAANSGDPNEILYQEMLRAAPIAGEVVEGHPIRTLWEDRKSTLLQAGYIESRQIPLSKPLSAKGAVTTFFYRFQSRFHGVEMGVRTPDRDQPPIAMVTARKTDFGPKGAIEQFLLNYDPEK